jgi:hypothetical protein
LVILILRLRFSVGPLLTTGDAIIAAVIAVTMAPARAAEFEDFHDPHNGSSSISPGLAPELFPGRSVTRLLATTSVTQKEVRANPAG